MVDTHHHHHHHRTSLRNTNSRRFSKNIRALSFAICVIVGLALVWITMIFNLLKVQEEKEDPLSSPSLLPPPSHQNIKNTTTITNIKTENNTSNCPSQRLSSILNDLTENQRNPDVGRRWMVRPPSGGNLYLMCCDTTKGSFSILLHERWAPIGVKHLLNMIEEHYFDTEIPFFRCTDACQFGLSSNKTLTKKYGHSIPDDPLWLPTGPTNRFSLYGKVKIKRYPKGVLTQAGGGKNSRSNQFVLTLKPNKFMGGGSQWEVPLGEVVTVLDNDNRDSNISNYNDDGVSIPDIHTGYGEKGPSQGLLKREGVTDFVKKKWSSLDYILQCSIVDRLIVENDKD